MCVTVANKLKLVKMLQCYLGVYFFYKIGSSTYLVMGDKEMAQLC